MRILLRSTLLFCLLGLLSGCASNVFIDNESLKSESAAKGSYSLREVYGNRTDSGVSLILAFSGGGLRAAALAYGVMLELQQTEVKYQGRVRPLLNDVKVISSVSGGSFTAAYYGLHGDALFTEFEPRVLRQDLETQITDRVFSLKHLLSNVSRGEAAADVYSKTIFGDQTFADMRTSDAPLILINASDLSTGARISFVQDFFGLLCSDINSYPVSKAVAASAGVPLLFEPVVLENFDGCDVKPILAKLGQISAASGGRQMQLAATSLTKLATDKERYRYLHLVDGGITDNLGLRSIYEQVALYGGIGPFMQAMGRRGDAYSVLISVDASVDSSFGIGEVATEPSVEQTINAVTDIQLHRYNSATVELIRDEFSRWHTELSKAGTPVEPFFVDVSLSAPSNKNQVSKFNQIPTTLKLTDEQVDLLIETGRSLLRDHPEFQRLLKKLN